MVVNQVLPLSLEQPWARSRPSAGSVMTQGWWCDAHWSVCFEGDVRVPLWVKKGGMKFPADPDTPVIMIGPGTGVAPFRAAIQERVAQGRRGEGLGVPLAADGSVFSIWEGGTHKALGPPSTTLVVPFLQGTACSSAAARNPRTSTARQSGKSWSRKAS